MKIQGFILIDVDVVALNNAGKSQTSNFDNAVATKKIIKNGRQYTYVSGQAWRFWWRDTLQKHFGWELSPITRESKIAFTEADPITYPDDDIFGYMKAARETLRDENGEVALDKKGKPKKGADITVTRVSPLKNSAIISVGSVRVSENWSSMARQEGDSVPYGKEEYSAIMKGMFSLDIEQVGTFSSYNKTGFKNLSDKLKEKALKDGAFEIEDKFLKDKSGKAHKLIRIEKEVRKKRIEDTIKALKVINGGAMQTSNMGDVTPKFIILTTMSTGNHPFSHIASANGMKENDIVSLNIDAIKEVLIEYKEQIKDTVFIGIRKGFLEDESSELKNLEKDFPVEVLPVNEAIDKYTKSLEHYIL